MYSHHLHIQFDLFVIFTLISNEAAYTKTQKQYVSQYITKEQSYEGFNITIITRSFSIAPAIM